MRTFLHKTMLTVVCIWCCVIAYNTTKQGNYILGTCISLFCFITFLIIGGHDDDDKNNPKPKPRSSGTR